MTKVTFTGGKELERQLLALTEKVAKSIGRKALRKAANPILKAARANVPVREGRVKKALRLKIDQKFNRGGGGKMPELEAKISLSGPGAATARRSANGKTQSGTRPDVYGALTEYGTDDTPPQPFMRPAWDAEGGQTAIDRLGRELGAEIEREAGKG